MPTSLPCSPSPALPRLPSLACPSVPTLIPCRHPACPTSRVYVSGLRVGAQAFFNEDMGVPMRMLPDYDTLECRFQFGVPPTAEDEAAARTTPCFGACPAAGELRERLAKCHTMGSVE